MDYEGTASPCTHTKFTVCTVHADFIGALSPAPCRKPARCPALLQEALGSLDRAQELQRKQL